MSRLVSTLRRGNTVPVSPLLLLLKPNVNFMFRSKMPSLTEVGPEITDLFCVQAQLNLHLSVPVPNLIRLAPVSGKLFNTSCTSTITNSEFYHTFLKCWTQNSCSQVTDLPVLISAHERFHLIFFPILLRRRS